jgi:hypothetical protein
MPAESRLPAGAGELRQHSRGRARRNPSFGNSQSEVECSPSVPEYAQLSV